MDQKKIGNFIAGLRKEKGMTQKELADRLHVTDRAVGNWENGRRMPDYSYLEDLCAILGITINELLSGERIKQDEYVENAEKNLINLRRQIERRQRIFSIAQYIFSALLVCMFIGNMILNYKYKSGWDNTRFMQVNRALFAFYLLSLVFGIVLNFEKKE